MMKIDEQRLLVKLASRTTETTVRDVISELGMNTNRGCYICQKWAERGWYDYGVSVDLGWLTDAGRRMAAVLEE